MATIEEIRKALRDNDRTVDAFIPLDWAAFYPNNYRNERGVVAWVYDVRETPAGLEVKIDERTWAAPVEVRINWNLCDGCHAVVSQCCCAEIQAEEEAERGPYCGRCGGYAYEVCMFAHLYEPGDCPGVTGVW